MAHFVIDNKFRDPLGRDLGTLECDSGLRINGAL